MRITWLRYLLQEHSKTQLCILKLPCQGNLVEWGSKYMANIWGVRTSQARAMYFEKASSVESWPKYIANFWNVKTVQGLLMYFKNRLPEEFWLNYIARLCTPKILPSLAMYFKNDLVLESV